MTRWPSLPTSDPGFTRAHWLRWHDICWLCQAKRHPEVECHEIARGSNRQKALKEPCTWMCVCRECHREVEGWPVARQLALKKLRDPDHYDRKLVNGLRGREQDAVSRHEVYREGKKLRELGVR